ncbi:MAG: hypothetical protein JWO95_2719 [Verrucomicrobiales bacterium]|nr:hypothetical protein [Verrucomicrobiales bacterium]
MGSSDWSTILVRQSDGDDEAAFKLLFELFEQYVADRERLGYEAIKSSYLKMEKEFHEKT